MCDRHLAEAARDVAAAIVNDPELLQRLAEQVQAVQPVSAPLAPVRGVVRAVSSGA